MEDEIVQFDDCKVITEYETMASVATEWASVAHEEQIDEESSFSAVDEIGLANPINAVALNSAVSKLGEPKPINAVALDSAVYKLGEPKPINAEALNSAEQSVSPHSPDNWPTVSISYSFVIT